METKERPFLVSGDLPHIARSVFLRVGFLTMLECRRVCSAWTRAIDQALLGSVFMVESIETRRLTALWSEKTPRVREAFKKKQGLENDVNRMYADRGEVFACLRDGRVRVFRATTGIQRGTIARWWNGTYNIHDFELTFSETNIIVRYPMYNQNSTGSFIDVPERLLVVNRSRLEEVAAFTASNMFTRLLMAEAIFGDVVLRCEYNPEVQGTLSFFRGSVSQRTLDFSRMFPIRLAVGCEVAYLDSSVLPMENCFTAVCADGNVKLIDYDNGEDVWCASVFEGDSGLDPNGLSLRAGGQVLVVTLFDAVQETTQISIVNVSNGNIIRSLKFANGTFCRAHTVSDRRLYCLSDELFSAPAKRLLSVLSMDTLKIVDTEISQLIPRQFFIKDMLAISNRLLLLHCLRDSSTHIFLMDVSSDKIHTILGMMQWSNQMWSRLCLLSDYELAFRDLTQRVFMVASFVSKPSLNLPMDSKQKYCFYFNRSPRGCKNTSSTCAFRHELAPACRYGPHCSGKYCAFGH